MKSAEIPEPNDAPVKIIVGKTFKDLVLNSDKEVLVKFYAPWCGHCKTLAPHFDEAAERLANNPNILIAKVDSTENEVSAVDIQGFPTLKFWGKDKSQPPIDFNGERSADGIIQWLKDHTSYEWIESGDATAEAEIEAELWSLWRFILFLNFFNSMKQNSQIYGNFQESKCKKLKIPQQK